MHVDYHITNENGSVPHKYILRRNKVQIIKITAK